MKKNLTKVGGNILACVIFVAILAVAAAIITACVCGIVSLWRLVNLRPAENFQSAETSEGAAWIIPESGEAAVWLSTVFEDEAETARVLEEYTEGDVPVPAWWNPDEPMSSEWFAEEWAEDVQDISDGDMNATNEAHPPVGIDPGGVDWNIETELVGWDGHRMAVWELDLFSRVFYLEFWQPNLMLCEAGCDAMLNLWASGLYGRTLFDALSYYDPEYGYTYRVYPHVWETEYDADGLAWCREFCEERFYNGPEWSAMYFQLGGYHDPTWVTPAYEIAGVYFSTGKGW